VLELGLVVVEGRKTSTSKLDKAWKARKTNCEKTSCVHLVPEEAYNCVNSCTSSVCYDEVYGKQPLEDGEIDHSRSRLFANCARKEERELKNKK